MGIPAGIGIIDTMMGTRAGTTAKQQNYAFLRQGQLKDAESQNMNFPAQYMFKDVPFSDQARTAAGPVEEPPQGADLLLPEMDRWGVEKAMIGVSPSNSIGLSTLQAHPDRFIGAYEVDPNKGMDEIRTLVMMVEKYGVKAATAFPAGLLPQVPINDKKFYPFYAKCVELDIPVQLQVGQSLVYDRRAPKRSVGRPITLDAVACDFPELKIVGIHVGIPWTDEMVAMAWKHPNVYIGSDAHSPKYWPESFVRYIDSYGQDKVMFGTDFPVLQFERTREEVEALGFRPGPKRKFLRDNALRLYKLA
jgi:predicted TIM-barrel fold metal-dependent hydrolase